MIAIIDLYRKELLKVNGFAASTVETYTLSIKAFCSFAKNELKTNPVKVKGPQLLQWMMVLKNTGTRGASACAARRTQPYGKSSLCPEKLFYLSAKNRRQSIEPGRGSATFNKTPSATHQTGLNP
jgi:hypothetical protein